METPDCIDALTDRYPGQAERITQLYELDATFREICSDHHSVTASIATLRRRAATTERELEQLQALLTDLEGEIAQYVGAPAGDETA